MTDIGELVTFAMLDSSVGKKCPFNLEPIDVDDPEDEDIPDDDRRAVEVLQDNDGGKLGKNLEKGSPGVGGSWNDVGIDPPRFTQARLDTRRSKKPGKIRVVVVGDTTPRPFTVAAHHLIPGNAALYDSTLFNSYMKKGGKIKLKVLGGAEKTFELDAHIGYNVNGSHNGVWLPGSYAIRSGASPTGNTWSILNDPKHPDSMVDWCLAYMATVAKVCLAQFHDTHEEYSEKVLIAIDKTAARLAVHQQGCKDCESKTKIPPPYAVVKSRLHRTSQYLRGKTVGSLRSWKRPWFTSDQVMNKIWTNPTAKRAFAAAYRNARSDTR